MRMRIRFHAQAAELAERGEAELEITPGASCREIKRVLGERHPRLRGILPHCVLATERGYLSESSLLEGSLELHLLPPVSGG